MTLDMESFIAECRSALAGDSPARHVREIVERAVSTPGAVVGALGTPTRAGLHPLYRSDDLTVLNVVWAPSMTLMPHDHRMWAVIGVYGGREDNIFWRRIPGESGGRIEAARARALSDGDAVILAENVIHSVTNPIPRLSAAIHVYGGNFFAAERSEWDPERLLERPYDVERATRMFEEAAAR